jgi:hypothetical protein
MKRLLFLVLLFFLLLPVVFSLSLEERSFKDMGYEDMIVEESTKEECMKMVFSKETALNQEGHYTILSLHVLFFPTTNGGAQVKVFLNDLPVVKVLSPEDFLNDWARVVLPRKGLKEKNNLMLCLRTSETISRIELRNDSMIGTYLSPDFSGKDSFVKEIISRHPRVGKELEVRVLLYNKGSKESKYKIIARDPSLDRPEIPVLEGKTIDEGVIKAGETIELVYKVRPSIVGGIVFPNAVAFVENAFGEEVRLESNYPETRVYALDHKLKPIVLSEKGIIEPKEKTSVVLLVKNDGISPQFEVSVELLAEKGLEVEGSLGNQIKNINPSEIKRFQFKVSSLKEGTYKIGCSLSYLDQNIEEVKCNPIELVVRKKSIEPQILAGLVMLLIGFAIYLYIYFK